MVKLGPFLFRAYGLIVSLATLVTLGVCWWESKRKKKETRVLIDLAFWVLLGSLVGARLYHVIHEWSFYIQHPLMIFNFWAGGLGIYGAFIGGLLAAYLYAQKKKLKLLEWLDIGAVGMPLGQAIGRWANYVTQELYGYPTDLPWAVYIPYQQRLPQFKAYSHFHPLFLYESLWDLTVFFIVFWASRRWTKKLLKGELFLLYLSLYSVGRFFLEFLKPDAWQIFGLATAQLIALLIIAISLLTAWLRRRK